MGASPQTPGIYRFWPSTGFADCIGWLSANGAQGGNSALKTRSTVGLPARTWEGGVFYPNCISFQKCNSAESPSPSTSLTFIHQGGGGLRTRGDARIFPGVDSQGNFAFLTPEDRSDQRSVVASPTAGRTSPVWCIRVECHRRHAASAGGHSCRPDSLPSDALNPLCSPVAEINHQQPEFRAHQPVFLRRTGLCREATRAPERCRRQVL